MLDVSTQIFKGNIIHTPTMEKFEIIENGYIIVVGNKVDKVVTELPIEYQYFPINNYGNQLIIPGLNDMHIHAPQFPNRGLCLDESLIKWLFDCTFPLEGKFKDLDYARGVYANVIHSLWLNGNTRSLVYDTVFYDSTLLLYNMFVKSGLGAYVGRVNMDINAPEYLLENTEESLKNTERFILETKGKSDLVKPIIAPRFVPSCSPKLLSGLGLLAKKYHVPVMSHLSEDLDEIELVKDMYPEFETYGEIYNYFGLFGQEPTVMGHCVYSNDRERELMKRNGVWADHNPSSNLNLGSGLMPVRKFLNMGIKVGLGCDVAGGGDVSLFNSMKDAIASSKLVWLYSGKKLEPLKSHEAFYLATMGGGSFFGKLGCFRPGYEFDALILNDEPILDQDYSLEQRIKRFLYIGNRDYIKARYVSGRFVAEPFFD